MSDFLFSYGTLQRPDIQLKLFGRTLKGYPDRLKGYTIVSVNITDERFLKLGESNIQKIVTPSTNAGDVIDGVVYELTDEELVQADKYEPDNYKRVKFRFESGREAWVYVEKG